MRKVYPKSSDVIHLFAQRTQDEARCRNVYFYNKYEIYSYGKHYLLAKFINNNTIWINDDGYSATTNKHVSEISYGSRQYKQFFKSKTDLDTVHSSVLHNKKKLANARKPELYINPILDLWKTLNEYLGYTKAKKYKSNPKYKEIKRIVKALNDNSEDFREKLRIAAIKEAKARKRREFRLLKENLEKFNNYEINSFRVGDEDYLRLSKDGSMIETSQYIRIKVENAKILYKLIVKGVDVKGRRIEHYTITSINGSLKVGCHNININSVHEIGKKLLQ